MSLASRPQERPQWWAIPWSEDLILPARCPACFSLGSRPARVPTSGGWLRERDAPELTAHYCDLCAEHQATQETRRLALLLAATIAALALVTSCALALGSLHQGWQFGVTGLAGLALAGALRWTDSRLRFPLALSRQHPRWLMGWSQRYLAQVSASTPKAVVHAPQRPWARCLLPGAAACTWLVLLHTFGTAKLVVVQSTGEPTVLLVDQRRRATILPSPDERPGPGHVVATLGGRRRIALLSESGEPLIDEWVTLWPQRTFVVSPRGTRLCFYVETQEYGAEGSAHEWQALLPPGPIWQPPVHVDRWFAAPEERPGWKTSGGVRRALRRLPCDRPPLAAPAR